MHCQSNSSTARGLSRPIRTLLKPLRAVLVGLMLLLPTAVPSMAMAQDTQDELFRDADGRLRGYEEQNVVIDDSSTALTYFLLAGLTILAVGVTFKSARRTHLD